MMDTCHPSVDDGVHGADVEPTTALRHAMADLAFEQGTAMVLYGARIVVAGELIASVLRHLPPATRSEIAGTFRERIDRLLALGDETGVPAEYTSEMLGEVNRYLFELKG